MTAWHEKLGLTHPVMQAGMGGGLSSSELVLAVCAAGGLGTLGLMPPDRFAAELELIRSRAAGRPFAANLLMPFTRAAHVAALLRQRPAVVTLFFGFDRALVARLRQAGIVVLHQVGDRTQAQRALDDGADGLIAQGGEAGGHLAGARPLKDLLASLRPIAGARPLLAAGGLHDAATARQARSWGADGAVAGTRFLLAPESFAHDAYKARLLDARTTLRTNLFGMAWPAPHRVVPNAATDRWCAARRDGPRWSGLVNALAVPTRRVLPMESVIGLVQRQRLSVPLYTPAAITREMDPRQLDVTPLYAGECVATIRELKPAGAIVAELAEGFGR